MFTMICLVTTYRWMDAITHLLSLLLFERDNTYLLDDMVCIVIAKYIQNCPVI